MSVRTQMWCGISRSGKLIASVSTATIGRVLCQTHASFHFRLRAKGISILLTKITQTGQEAFHVHINKLTLIVLQ